MHSNYSESDFLLQMWATWTSHCMPYFLLHVPYLNLIHNGTCNIDGDSKNESWTLKYLAKED
ncbi:hypothetical protein HanRHA438_Chr04g0202451 [Helianthus annuus]|nr:hypothetical protein HanRHA438_Chr04g0202451 [Helianthus annuus]